MVTDEELVQRIRRGETRAFDELYRRYSRRLFGYIRRHVHQRDQAEDLLQDVLLSVLQDRSFDLRQGRFGGWLFTVARNRCLTHVRDSTREADKRQALLEASGNGTTTRSEEVLQRRQQVRSALAKLPETHQDALLLKQVGELTYGEIARIQGVPEGTVKSRLHFAVRAIQRELARQAAFGIHAECCATDGRTSGPRH